MTTLDPARWHHLSALLDEVLDSAPADRPAWLAELKLCDPEAAVDVAALLGDLASSEAVGFLEGKPSSATEAVCLGSGPAGEVLGAYTLESSIGEGGTGSVWRARRSDDRYEGHVAVKLLNASLIGRSGNARFKREGRILALLSHPNIARLIDAGVSEAGQPYFVLELVPGERIDRWCDARRLGIAERIALMLDVLSAVEHAHANLVVHRDIKPANVLVDDGGTVKLLDFGIAKLLDRGRVTGGDLDLTLVDGRPLTPDSAAPEQIAGKPITTATDVHALGVLLYALLCGRHPWEHARESAAQLARAIVESEPPLLSAAVSAGEEGTLAAAARGTTPERLRKALRGDLDNIVAKALQKAPEDRYPTAEAFAQDLRRHLAREPVSARQAAPLYRLGRFVSRHRAGVAVAALFVMALLAGLAGTLVESRRASDQAMRAEALATEAQHARDRALTQLGYAEATDAFLVSLLQEGSGKPFTAVELLGRGEKLVAEQYAQQPEMRSRLLYALGGMYGDLMDQGRARSLLESAQAAASASSDAPLTSGIDCTLAQSYADAGDIARAQLLVDGAVERLRRSPEVDRAALANCLSARSSIDGLRRDTPQQLKDAQEATALLANARPSQFQLVVDAHSALARAHGALGDDGRAVEEYQRAADDLLRAGRGQSLDEATALQGVATHLSRAGQWARASETCQRSLQLTERVTGAANAPPAPQTNCAKLLVELGRYDEAKALFAQASHNAERLGHARSTGPVAMTSSSAWCATDDIARCAELLEVAHRSLVAALPPGHSLLGSLGMLEAQLALAKSEPEAARDRLREAAAIFAKARDRNPNRLRVATLQAVTETALGHADEALRLAASAVAQARSALSGFAASGWLGEALLAQGQAQAAAGHRDEARASWREALQQLQASVGADAPATRLAARLLASS